MSLRRIRYWAISPKIVGASLGLAVVGFAHLIYTSVSLTADLLQIVQSQPIVTLLIFLPILFINLIWGTKTLFRHNSGIPDNINLNRTVRRIQERKLEKGSVILKILAVLVLLEILAIALIQINSIADYAFLVQAVEEFNREIASDDRESRLPLPPAGARGIIWQSFSPDHFQIGDSAPDKLLTVIYPFPGHETYEPRAQIVPNPDDPSDLVLQIVTDDVDMQVVVGGIAAFPGEHVTRVLVLRYKYPHSLDNRWHMFLQYTNNNNWVTSVDGERIREGRGELNRDRADITGLNIGSDTIVYVDDIVAWWFPG